MSRTTAYCWLFIAALAFAQQAQEKPRVFVTGANSAHVSGSGGTQEISAGGDSDTAEVVKLFRSKCSAVSVNMLRERADYVVLARDDGSGALRRGRKIVVSNRDGDVILANSTKTFSGSVNDACKAISKDWVQKAGKTK